MERVVSEQEDPYGRRKHQAVHSGPSKDSMALFAFVKLVSKRPSRSLLGIPFFRVNEITLAEYSKDYFQLFYEIRIFYYIRR